MTTTQLFNLIETNGGHTHWFDGFPCDAGYVVGNGNLGIQIPFEECKTFPDLFVVRLKTILKSNWISAYDGVGFWEEDGILYVDPVNHCLDLNEAESLAVHRGEKAFFDIANGKVIYVREKIRMQIFSREYGSLISEILLTIDPLTEGKQAHEKWCDDHGYAPDEVFTLFTTTKYIPGY